MNNLTVFVVEDNINALNMLVNDLNEHFKELSVIGKASTVIEAAKKLQGLEPDMLLLDIMLGDSTAFDLLEILPNLKSKIIFITASDEYAVKAFKFSAIDYILKPYSIKELDKAIHKAKNDITPQKEQLDILNSFVKKPTTNPSKISLHTSEKIVIVEIDAIIRCESDNNYTTFYIKNSKNILVSKTLKYYAEMLKDNGFIRVHQSHLINKNYIKEYIKSDGGYLLLDNNKSIPVSTRKRAEVLQLLSKY